MDVYAHPRQTSRNDGQVKQGECLDIMTTAEALTRFSSGC